MNYICFSLKILKLFFYLWYTCMHLHDAIINGFSGVFQVFFTKFFKRNLLTLSKITFRIHLSTQHHCQSSNWVSLWINVRTLHLHNTVSGSISLWTFLPTFRNTSFDSTGPNFFEHLFRTESGISSWVQNHWTSATSRIPGMFTQHQNRSQNLPVNIHVICFYNEREYPLHVLLIIQVLGTQFHNRQNSVLWIWEFTCSSYLH